MPPSLTLAPWELSPDCDAPLTAPADLVFPCRWSFTGLQTALPETQLWFRAVRYGRSYIHYFCDAAHPDEGNWIFSDQGRYVPISKFPLNPVLVQRIFASEEPLWWDHISRLLYFEGADYGHAGLHRIKVSPDGYGLFSFAAETSWEIRNPNALFRIPTEEGQVAASATTLKTQLMDLLREDASETRFAFDWLHQSELERREAFLHFERGDASQLQRLLHAVLQSEPDIWEANETLCWRTYLKRERFSHPSQFRDDLRPVDAPSSYYSTYPARIKIPQRLKNWKTLLWSYFAPSVNEEIPRFSLCARHWDSGNSVGTFAAEVSPPTAHERLEAVLTLRDWWGQNIPAQPFEAFPVPNRKLAR